MIPQAVRLASGGARVHRAAGAVWHPARPRRI